MKRKLLEILVDEKGKVFISSEINPLDKNNPEDMNGNGSMTNLVDSFVEALLDTYMSEPNIGRIIKSLTIADISVDLQPYECIEHLWFSMMHTFLPRNETRFRKMKEARGFYTEVVEPIRIIDNYSDSTLS